MRPSKQLLVALATLVVPAALAVLLVRGVDLSPKVGESFFFSADNPAFREVQEIERTFPASEHIVVVTAELTDGSTIESERYRQAIARLTERFAALDGVTSVRSLASGPDDLSDARESPLWRRLLLVEGAEASHLVLIVRVDEGSTLIERIDGVVGAERSAGLELRVAGPPYIAEKIRANLARDFARFSAAAVVVFGLLVALLFRSLPLTLGALVACGSAVLATLVVQDAVGVRIGLLTSNLTTIVFVLTQSHIVFMTGNWKGLGSEARADPGAAAARAWRRTAGASVWCMVTTLLGFASLLLVAAKPLRELGTGGVIGTLAAIACAYGLYPPFLAWAGARAGRRAGEGDGHAAPRRALAGPGRVAALALLAAVVALGAGIPRLDTDPAVLSYFEPDGELGRDLAFIDAHGGVSPLKVAVRRQDGERLDSASGYERMWEAQGSLERIDEVGTVVSLPALMAEADRAPLAWLLPWESLVDLMDSDLFDRVASGFVSEDREQGLFVARMREADRGRPRAEVLEEVRDRVASAGLRVSAVGGAYRLQGEMASLVTRSLVQGLAALVGLFGLVAWIVARDLRTAAAMIVCAAAVPVAMLGGIAWTGVPLDVISAPAANVCIGMAVDAMIHLSSRARRFQRDGSDRAEAWARARGEQLRSVVVAAVVVGGGFAIFGFSSFPPTMRFGLEVLAGTVVAALAALFTLPWLAGGAARRSRAGRGSDARAA